MAKFEYKTITGRANELPCDNDLEELGGNGFKLVGSMYNERSFALFFMREIENKNDENGK